MKTGDFSPESQDMLSNPSQDRLGELKALAAELRGSKHLDGPLRWMANLAASFLLTQSLALQPVHAGDAVNYSEFIDSAT